MEFFGMLADGMSIGILATDLQGAIHYANQTFCDILGIPIFSTADGANILHRFPSPSREAFARTLAKAAIGPSKGRFEITSSDGSEHTIRLAMQSIRQRGRVLVWIVARDVTEMIETRQALHETEASLHSLSGRLLQIQDEERRRMARELHDITGQKLAVLIMSLSQLARHGGLEDAGVDRTLTEAADLLREVDEEVRTLSYLLHPPMLDELGLGAALHWYAEGFARRSSISVDVDIADLPRLSREKETALFRVVQEALTNVLRHSSSKTARIRGVVEDDALRVYVEDSGRGFREETVSDNTGRKVTLGVGIRGMRERLQQLGGALQIQPLAPGTQVCASVPIGEEIEQAWPEGMETAIPKKAPSQRQNLPGGSAAPWRILVAEDHEVVRRGIQALIEVEPDLDICGEAVDGIETVNKARQLQPDLIILDLTLPEMGGLTAARKIREANADVKILVFTNHSYPMVQPMINNVGCNGYIHKSHAASDLIRGIRALMNGETFFNPDVASSLSA